MSQNKTLLIVITLILLSFNANAQQNSPIQQELCPVVVSFYSMGSGTNKIARNAFKNYVEKFEKKYNVKLNLGETPWGREGETDYCFELTILSKNKKNKFIAGLKETLGKAPQVRISENAPCIHRQ